MADRALLREHYLAAFRRLYAIERERKGTDLTVTECIGLALLAWNEV